MSTGPTSTASMTAWTVIVTEWALNSYLDLKHRNVFTDAEYWNGIRPDVELLKGGIPPTDPKFGNSKFWGPAKLGNQPIAAGYKMKWHQMGPGKVQLRLPVTPGKHAGASSVFLCHCYEKPDDKYERRMMANFKRHMNLIALNRYTYRGAL